MFASRNNPAIAEWGQPDAGPSGSNFIALRNNNYRAVDTVQTISESMRRGKVCRVYFKSVKATEF